VAWEAAPASRVLPAARGMRVATGPGAGPGANLGNWFAGSHRYI
jgi:hypothetical protein